MKTNSPYHHASAAAPSTDGRRSWLRYCVRLNTILILAPVVFVTAAYLLLQYGIGASSIQLSGSSGSVGPKASMLSVAYVVVPNLLMAFYAVTCMRNAVRQPGAGSSSLLTVKEANETD